MENTTILVADHHEASRCDIAAIARKEGFTVIEAATGNEVLEKTSRLKPSLVVMDIELPGGDGHDVCRQLKADPSTSSLPVIHLSAPPHHVQETPVCRYGRADACLFKPIVPSELIAVIKAILHIQGFKQENGREAMPCHITLDASSDPLRLVDHKGRIALYNKAFADIDERKQAQDSLQESTELFKNLFEYHTAVKLVIDPISGDIVDANQAAEHFYGWSREHLRKMRIQQINTLPPKEVDSALKRARDLKNNHLEFRHRLADGSLRDVEVFSSLITINGREYLHSIIHDISKRKEAEATFFQERQLYKDLINTMPAGIYRLRVMPRSQWREKNWRSKFSIDIVSDRFCGIIGVGRQGFLANPRIFFARIHPDDKPGFIKENVRAISSRSLFIWEGRMLLPDKADIWVHFESIPRKLTNGEMLWTGILTDISEQKKAEIELKASNERYHELFRSNPHPMWVCDMETLGFLEVNDAAVNHYQYTREEFLSMTLKDIRPAEDIPRLLESAASIENTVNEAGVWRHLKKDGSLIDVEIVTHTLLYGNRPAKMILVRDITEQLRVQAASKRLMAAIEHAGESIVVTDQEGIFLYVNPAFERISGFAREEVIGKKPGIFKSGEHDAAFYDDLWQTISNGSIWRGRFINRRKDGTFYTEDAVISPVSDASGRINNYVAVKRDITESQKLEAQLRQAQKMESVGRLAGGVAHDFNNMLSVIIGYAQLALEKTDPTDTRYKALQEISTAAARSATITRQLLAFARKQIITPRILNLNKTVGGTLSMLRRLIGEDIKLIWQPAASLNPIKIDPSQIDQILANLCVNARDAITGVGNIIIETAMARLDAEYCTHHAGAIPGDYILLSVSDDGCGMEKRILDKIYEPFFTTKETGKGTGLGLSTVYGIVKQNNGFINAYSEPGRGTTLRIYLPQHLAKEIEITEEVETAPQSGHGETILVVEDEAAILELTSTILDGLGYHVLTADSPAKALRLAEELTDKIALLITDVIMPEMNGRDLADRVLIFNPQLRYLFMSGYPTSVIANSNVLAEGVHFIQKPFSARDLADKVHEVLLS